jgi:hypothetical protein
LQPSIRNNPIIMQSYESKFRQCIRQFIAITQTFFDHSHSFSKRMNARYRSIKPLLLTVCAILLSATAQNCMQTVTPLSPSARTLTVLARQTPDGTPLSGITVEAADDRTGEKFATLLTNDNGEATLRLENVPVFGRNFVLSARRGVQVQPVQQLRVPLLVCNDTTVTLLFPRQITTTATGTGTGTGMMPCNDCPTLQTPTSSLAFTALPAVPVPMQESFSSRLDGTVFVGVPELGMMASVVRTYTVQSPMTACAAVDVAITPTFTEQYSNRFFTISPRTLRIQPGERAFFQVNFTPPDAAAFATILTDPARRTGTAVDSSFSVGIALTTLTCSQRLRLSARVSVVPDISPILNLRAYRQRTRLKPQEENEVYTFGEQSRRILRSANGSAGVFPPLAGDIYADVANNDSSANAPQAPTLNIVPGGAVARVSAAALWREVYAEQDFDNVAQTFRAYRIAPPTMFATMSIRPVPGQVYAFRFGTGSVALLYVRRVDNGTERNTNGQSGVEFRAIYPIIAQ